MEITFIGAVTIIAIAITVAVLVRYVSHRRDNLSPER
jgi:hypothetical protein